MKLITNTAAALLFVLTSTTSFAQSPAEIIEQARAEARLIKEYEEGLTDPDPTVRIAVFEAMLKLPNPTLHKQALSYAFSTNENNLRVAAFKHHVLKLSQLAIHLSPDTSLSKENQQEAIKQINQNGNVYALVFSNIDPDSLTFEATDSIKGQVSNLQLNATNSINNSNRRQINLTLTTDNILEGTATIGYNQFKAIAYLD